MKNIISSKLKNAINNKVILITGGTGSFGKEFVKLILKKYNPKKIIIYSRDEFKQWEMKNSVTKNQKKLRFFIGDVRDYSRLLMAFKDVDLVIHAAALKHVPIAEYNPIEYINTNIIGAQNVIEAAISAKVNKVIALSTDKAANPANLYGATKLASDKLFSAANNLSGSKKIMFSIVRYGNVLGSRGSFIPKLFHLKKDKKLTVPLTSNEMTRFWISLEGSVNFVLNTILRMRGGEIFIPKIPSIKIVDLINCIAPDNPKKIIGIRPGEKLHEVLCPEDDSYHTLEYKDHYVIFPILDENISFSKKVFTKNPVNEKGTIVKKDFSYTSKNNKVFLKKDEIKKILREI